MAINVACEWEIRSGGNAQNGGGYVRGSGTTDYSQQDAAVLNLTDVASDGAGTGLSSVTGGFTDAMVGNILQIYGAGDGLTLGWYEITARADTNNITIDRSAGASKTGGDINVGGGINDMDNDTFNEQLLAGHIVWIEAGTYTQNAINVAKDGTAILPIQWVGYNSSHGDAPVGDNRPLIDMQANVLYVDNYWVFRNLRVTGTSAAMVMAPDIYTHLFNCKVTNTGNGKCLDLYYRGMTAVSCYFSASNNYAITACEGILVGCYFAGQDGIQTQNGLPGGSITNCIFDSLTGTTIDLATRDTYGYCITGCTFFTCATAISGGDARGIHIIGNIFDTCGTAVTWANDYGQDIHLDYNNFSSSTVTDTVNVTKGTNTTALDPEFGGEGGGDFSVGTNMKATGFPYHFNGTSTPFIDQGAVPREEEGGAATTAVGVIGG